MSKSTHAIQHKQITEVSKPRRYGMAAVEIGIALLIFFAFALNISPDNKTNFVMTPGGITQGVMKDLILPSRLTLIVMAALALIIGLVQLFKGFQKRTNLMVGLTGFLLIMSFLVWQGAGQSLNLGGMLTSAVLLAVPITLAAFAGILSERCGIVNIAIEGMMLFAAMTGTVVGSLTDNLILGVLGAIVGALALAAIHAMLSIKYKINQTISGTVINIFSAGITAYVSQKFLQVNEAINTPPMFGRAPIPLLSDIPFIGPILFNTNIFVYLLLIILVILQFALFSTRWGLRLRSVGEHPKAADTLGINVNRLRWMGVLLSGAIAGLAGAFFTLGSVGRFEEGMTAGKGFIGIAAMIFGNWNPIGSLGAGLLFGFADAIGSKLSILGSGIPTQFMAMAPYLITMIVLAGFIGKGQAPAAAGTPYDKE